MKRTLLAATILLFSIGSSAQAESWRASGNSTFDGHIAFCATEGGFISSETLPDGTIVDRFFNIGNRWFTGNPLIDGFERNEVTATFNPATREGTLDIRGTVDVDVFEGGWRFRQIVPIGPVFRPGIGFGVGSGDLRGKLIIYSVGAIEEGIESPCAVSVGVPIRGRIFSFRWWT